MLLCVGPNDRIQAWLDNTGPTFHIHVSGLDIGAGGTVTTYRKNTSLTSNVPTDIAVAPSSGTTRNIKVINVFNSHATLPMNFNLRLYDGSTPTSLISMVLQPGDMLQYVEGVGWFNIPPYVAEIDYTQITATTAAISATTEATSVAVITGHSRNYDGTDVRISFFCPGSTNGTAGITVFGVFYRDTTPLGQFRITGGNVTGGGPCYAVFFDTPAAGAHTYAIKAFVSSSTVTISAGAGGAGALVPAYLRVSRS